MNQEREYFLFRKEWCDAVSGLPDKMRYEIYDAIIGYGVNGESSDGLGSVARLAFEIAKAVIDRDNEELTRRESVSSAKSACGKLGGRPKTKTEKPFEDNSGKSTAKSTEKAELFEDENLEKDPESASSPRACVVEDNNKNISTDKKEDNQKKKKETHKKENESLPREKALEILDYFNRLVKECGSKIPKCLKLSEQRHNHLRQRHAEYGMEGLYEAIDKIFKSDFLSGKSNNKWRASFDWLICPTNFLKVIEGNYDNIQKNYGNNNEQTNIDPRRGTDAGQHAADEY